MDRDRLLKLFFELVQIYSPTGKEGGVADYITTYISGLSNVSIMIDDAGESFGGECGNLIVTFSGNNDARAPLALLSHMDTAQPCHGIIPKIDEDGRIYSQSDTVLGADDKAGVAMMLLLLSEVEKRPQDFGNIEFVFTVGEEKNLLGSKALDISRLRAKYGLVLDSNGPIGSMITSAPYAVNLKLKLKGRPAHAGIEPEKGISALTIAAKGVLKAPLGRLSPITTSNFGRIAGGHATNIVMEEVEIEGEARSLEKAELDRTVGEIEASFRDAADQMGGEAHIQVEESFPGYQISEDTPLVKLMSGVISDHRLAPSCRSSGGGSDASILNSRGIPCLNLGVAFHNPHSKDEYIMLEDISNLYDILRDVIQII